MKLDPTDVNTSLYLAASHLDELEAVYTCQVRTAAEMLKYEVPQCFDDCFYLFLETTQVRVKSNLS